MRKPNFNKLSNEVLENYNIEITDILKARKQSEEKKSKLLKKVKSLVEAEGMSMDTLLFDSANKSKKTPSGRPVRKVAPKYANPKDPSQTWTGRGRKPLWVVAHLNKKTAKITDLAI